MARVEKVNQHYVFQAYLKAWCSETSKLCWVRDKNGIEEKSPKAVAYEERFHRVEGFTDEEVKVYHRLVDTNLPSHLRAKAKDILVGLQTPDRLLQEWDSLMEATTNIFEGDSEKSREEIDELDNTVRLELEIEKTNLLEDIHGWLETQAGRWLKSLKSGDANFYRPQKQHIRNYRLEGEPDDTVITEKSRFLLFLATQFCRTKKMREIESRKLRKGMELLSQLKRCDPPQLDYQKIVGIFLTEALAPTLAEHMEGLGAKLSILRNTTSVPFITSDQPVINLMYDYSIPTQLTNEIILYYPVSPSVAIILNDDSLPAQLDLTIEQVQNYNGRMKKASYEYLFSNDRESLERIC